MNEILREIRVEYEQIQVKNRDEAEEWYKVRSSKNLFTTLFTFFPNLTYPKFSDFSILPKHAISKIFGI
jgi:hypothetical protein